jgi:hypothetical protein
MRLGKQKGAAMKNHDLLLEDAVSILTPFGQSLESNKQCKVEK